MILQCKLSFLTQTYRKPNIVAGCKIKQKYYIDTSVHYGGQSQTYYRYSLLNGYGRINCYFDLKDHFLFI